MPCLRFGVDALWRFLLGVALGITLVDLAWAMPATREVLLRQPPAWHSQVMIAGLLSVGSWAFVRARTVMQRWPWVGTVFYFLPMGWLLVVLLVQRR